MEMERRKFPRARLRWPVIAATEERTIYGTTADISIGGAFISCRTPLELGEIFDLVIEDVSLMDCPLPLDLSIKIESGVVRLKTYDPDDLLLHRGMGVRFVNISDAERELFSTLISYQCQSHTIDWRAQEPKK